jgi:hypothetical protein
LHAAAASARDAGAPWGKKKEKKKKMNILLYILAELCMQLRS